MTLHTNDHHISSSLRAVRGQRLKREDRERMILQGATEMFAELGFEAASTTLLAQRLGITQPLLYRYFPSKEQLIDRVFQEVFSPGWYARWRRILRDCERSASQRLIAFYTDYMDTVLTRDHVRLFMFGSLSGLPYNARHYDVMRQQIFPLILQALREEQGRSCGELPPTMLEMELIQSLHGAIYHLAIRRWIHAPPVPLPMPSADLIELKVVGFLRGANASWSALEPGFESAGQLTQAKFLLKRSLARA